LADCGQFLEVMDKVLDFLEDYGSVFFFFLTANNESLLFSDSKPVDVEKLKQTCEILLGHAMSVAHVAMDTDSQDIFYVSQKV